MLVAPLIMVRFGTVRIEAVSHGEESVELKIGFVGVATDDVRCMFQETLSLKLDG
ncbi:MAG: hypothetical protein ACKO4R_13570 [Synechococcales cyanobacterium]